jgi:uncharacterized protein (DUF697 family)
MNNKKKKRFPKVVLLTADDMREAGAGANQRREVPPYPVDLNEAATGRAAAANSVSLDNVVEMMPKAETSSPPMTTAALAPAASDATRRRLRAVAIVERHANFSAIGGVIPLPIANTAAIAAIMVRMVKSLSAHYGVPFQRNRARAIIIGLMGGIMPTGLATVATSTLIYFVPGYNLVGLAVSSVTASACARSIGQMFIDHFENGATLVEFPSAVLR